MKQLQHQDETVIRREVSDQKMVTEIIKGQSLNLDSKSNMKHPANKDDYPVRITMPQKQII